MRRYLFALLAMFACSYAATAAPITLTATDTGWYNNAGFHDSDNPNYIAGNSGGIPFRNFGVFDLSGISGVVTSASLVLDTATSTASTGLTYSVFDVTTPISALTASNTGATAIYSEIGSGTLFGTAAAPFAGPTVTLPFNVAGIAALNASLGGQFAFGGALPLAPPDEYVFGFSNAGGVRLQLDVAPAQEPAPIPEPATLAAFGALAAAGFGYTRRRLKCVPVA